MPPVAPPNRVVYVLGAGFSAPLGLPIMSNFIDHARDLYFGGSSDLSYFKEVLAELRNLAYIKHYYTTDLFNIEELFSILSMRKFSRRSASPKKLAQFICDTIQRQTPSTRILAPAALSNGGHERNPCGNQVLTGYGHFVLEVLRCRVRENRRHRPGYDSPQFEYYPKMGPDDSTRYAIVTTNYDMVLENCLDWYCNMFREGDKPQFESESFDRSWGTTVLAKLHGSAATGDIVPSTWEKASNSRVAKAWQLAHKALESANCIRVIGYSLPQTDTYMKYLLMSSIHSSDHLKQLDILCYDPLGDVANRFKSFICYQKMRFASAKTEDYLGLLSKRRQSNTSSDPRFALEATHREFFDEASRK